LTKALNNKETLSIAGKIVMGEYEELKKTSSGKN